MPHQRLSFDHKQSTTIESVAYDGTHLQISFRPWKEGQEPSHYSYQNFTPAMFAELQAAIARGEKPSDWLRAHKVIMPKGKDDKHPTKRLEPHEVWK